jgi:hypothetical protein
MCVISWNQGFSIVLYAYIHIQMYSGQKKCMQFNVKLYCGKNCIELKPSTTANSETSVETFGTLYIYIHIGILTADTVNRFSTKTTYIVSTDLHLRRILLITVLCPPHSGQYLKMSYFCPLTVLCPRHGWQYLKRP